MWKRKCESGEGGVRQDEYDDMKRKFMARIEDTESQIESCIAKIHTLEKQRNKMSGEVEDLMIEVERSVQITWSKHERFTIGVILKFG